MNNVQNRYPVTIKKALSRTGFSGQNWQKTYFALDTAQFATSGLVCEESNEKWCRSNFPANSTISAELQHSANLASAIMQ